jgi:hypothetical protein
MILNLEGREKVQPHLISNKVNEIIDKINEIEESLNKLKEVKNGKDIT